MGRKKRKACAKGHALTARNLYLRTNGQRECKTCSLARVRKSREK